MISPAAEEESMRKITRRCLLQAATAPQLLSFLLVSVAAASYACAESKAIVDVRFDAPFRQIESSMGDNWTPTWGRDDVLYTGCDDGSSFGGIPVSPIAFGKLEGSDPNQLRGTTVSG